MIPVLYESTEKEFKSNGLGGLKDAISCKVTEERNGEFELEMSYPVGGLHYDDIKHSRIILAKPADGEEPEPFEIYKITKPINGRVTIYARHISYRLSYTMELPDGNIYTDPQSALNSLKSHAESECPFNFKTDKTTVARFQHLTVSSLRSFLGGMSGSILDVYGGEYKWNRWTVNLLNARGQERPITLQYGVDITDLQQEENIETTYTAVLAVWTKKDESSGTSTVYSDLIKTSNADDYPYVRTFLYDCSGNYQEEPTKVQLNQRARAYINRNRLGVPKVSIKVSFIALWQTEEYKNFASLQHVGLCDTISVSFPKLGIKKTTAKVVKTDYDVLKERYNSIEIGDSRSTLAKTITDGDAESLLKANAQLEITERAIISKVTDDNSDIMSQVTQLNNSLAAEVKTRRTADLKASYLVAEAQELSTEVNGNGYVYVCYYDGSVEDYENEEEKPFDLPSELLFFIDNKTGDVYQKNGSEWNLYSSGDSAADEKKDRIRKALLSIRDAEGITTIDAGPVEPSSENYAKSVKEGDIWIDTSIFQDESGKNRTRYDVYEYISNQWVKLSQSTEEYAAKFQITEKEITSEVTSRKQADDDTLKAANDQAKTLANNAEAVAKAAQATADGKITTYYQDKAPEETETLKFTVGDLWINTKKDSKKKPLNTLYRWNGAEWEESQDQGISDAMQAAGDAQATADGKITTYCQDTEPKGTEEQPLTIGDLWVDTRKLNDDDTEGGKRLWRWDGQYWIEARDEKIKKIETEMSSRIDQTDSSIAAEVTARRSASMKDQYLIAAAQSFSGLIGTNDFAYVYYHKGTPQEYIDKGGKLDSAQPHNLYVDLNTSTVYQQTSTDLPVEDYTKIKYAVLSVKDSAGDILVFCQPEAPTEKMNEGSLWIDTSTYKDKDKNDVIRYDIYQYVSSQWVQISNSVKETTAKLELKIDEGTLTSHLNAEADEIQIKAGRKFTVESGNFSVDENGNVSMTGAINATSGTFSGNLNAAGGTFTGRLQAATGTFSGDLNAAGGTFSGNLQAAGGTFNGTLSANCISGGTIDANDVTIKNLIVGNNVSMGPNVTLAWDKVSDKPDLVDKDTATTITKDTIETANITAQNLHVQAANIDGTITATAIAATSGTIGGFIIDQSSIHTNGKSGPMSTTPGLWVSDNAFAFGTLGNSYDYGTDTYDGAGIRVSMDRYGNASLRVQGTVVATSGKIAGYTINDGYLKGGNGASCVGMSSTYNVMWAFWAGAEQPENAPFHVGHNGDLFAANATITGTINSSTINGTSISSSTFLASGTDGSGNSSQVSINGAGISTTYMGVSTSWGDAKVFLDAYNTSAVAFFYGNISVSGNVERASESNYSDRRLKNNITALREEDAERFIMGLKPSSYRFNGGEETRHGFIAQDVKQVLDEMGTGWGVWGVSKSDNNNFGIKDVQTISYMEIIPDLVSVVQKQNRTIKKLGKTADIITKAITEAAIETENNKLTDIAADLTAAMQ